MDYCSNYNRLLMEKHYSCSGQLDCQKGTTAVFITGVKLGNANSCFCFMCLCLWISDMWVLRQLVSSGVILLLWLVLFTGSSNQSWTLEMVWDYNIAKGRNSLPKYHNHFRPSLLLQNSLGATRLENCSACYCSLGLRSSKWILDLLVCRWLGPSPWPSFLSLM